jgi:hypothetical protein
MLLRMEILGPHDGGEPVDLAETVGAHLDDRVLVLFGELEQAQGHPDEVVVVLLGLEAGPVLGQDGGAQLLHRGLARGAGDAHDDGIILAPDIAGDVAQGCQGVFHGDDGAFAPQPFLHDDCAGSPFGNGLGDEHVAVEVLAPERHEEIAFAHGSRVSGHPGKDRIGAAGYDGSLGAFCDFPSLEFHDPYISLKHVRTHSRSSKELFFEPMIW